MRDRKRASGGRVIVVTERPVAIPLAHDQAIEADLVTPEPSSGVVVFAHGSGSSRHSPRNREVAGALHSHGFTTLLVDMLTAEEEQVDLRTRQLRFDVELLAHRLSVATSWVRAQADLAGLPVGYFGASTGAAAALIASADEPERVATVVSRGGRPDLAGDRLGRVRCPTLLIVGGDDEVVLDLNRQARAQMHAEVALEVVPGASHLFEEPGALEAVADAAVRWFADHFDALRRAGGGGLPESQQADNAEVVLDPERERAEPARDAAEHAEHLERRKERTDTHLHHETPPRRDMPGA